MNARNIFIEVMKTILPDYKDRTGHDWEQIVDFTFLNNPSCNQLELTEDEANSLMQKALKDRELIRKYIYKE